LALHRNGALALVSGLRSEKVENRGVRSLGCVGDRYTTQVGNLRTLGALFIPDHVGGPR